MGIPKTTAADTLRLPAKMALLFRAEDQLVIWADGDALYLKRITRRAVTRMVAEAPEEGPLSMEEINEIVHD